MHLDQPDRLLWLLLIPLLFLLSRPPRPRTRVATAHLAQWLAAQARLRRRPLRFRWLRFLLLLLGFGFLVAAYSRPATAAVEGKRILCVLLDQSASMAARGADGRSRFAQAKQECAALLDALPAHIEIRLALCAAQTRVVLGSRAELREALQKATVHPVGDPPLARISSELSSPEVEVWSLTDIDHAEPPGAGALLRLGQPGENCAILALQLEDPWPLPEIAGRVRVCNQGNSAVVLRLGLEGGGQLLGAANFELAAGAEQSLPIKLHRGSGGTQVLSLTRQDGVADARPDDDRLQFELPRPPQPRILLREAEGADGTRDPGLALVAGLLAEELGGQLEAAAEGRSGFLITDGGRLEALPAQGRCICLGTRIGDPPPAQREEVELVSWDRSHPVCQGLDFSGLRVRAAFALAAEPGDQVLLHGREGPLLLLRPRGRGAALLGAFRCGDSNLTRLAAFPQLLRRAMAAAYGAGARPSLPEPRPRREARLLGAEAGLQDRPLSAFFVPSQSLALPCLALALLCLALRVLV